MKNKNLVLANGIVGLVFGIMLLIWPIMLALGTEANVLIRLAVIALGIIAIVYYKDTALVKMAANVLFIVGGAVAFIPFLGWAGGICIIIGGSLYLASLKNFNKN